MNAEIWQMIDRFATVIGTIVSIPVFWSFYILLSMNKRRERILEHIRKTPGKRPAVLIVDVIKPDGESIRAQVEHWIRDRDEFKDTQPNSIYVSEFRGEMAEHHMDEFVTTIRTKIGSVMGAGADRIHLFIRSPMPVALSVGEILSNSGCPVIMYHNQLNEGYQNWGLLHR
jgi:hypothetical protein